MRLALSLATVLLAAAPAAAGELRVDAPACGPVHLVARDVPLGDVLQALAREVGFELKLESAAARSVDIELRKPAVELIARLTRGDNVVIQDGPDTRCRQQVRPVRVWLLPRGGEAAPRPRELSAMDQYRKAHGMPLEDEEPATSDKAAPP